MTESLELSIVGLHGDVLCVVHSHCSWRVEDVSKAVEDQTGICTCVQKLILDVQELHSSQVLSEVLPEGSRDERELQLTLLQSSPPPEELIAAGRFEVGGQISSGRFATVHRGICAETKAAVAIKKESARYVAAPQLQHEAEILAQLAEPSLPQGFTNLYYFGTESSNSYLVMDMLGTDLETMVQTHGRFHVRTAVLVAEQVLQCIEYLHSRKFLHRDIEPSNFMFGIRSRVHHIYLIDLSLCKMYWDSEENNHIKLKTYVKSRGNRKFASRWASVGLEQSRRDDLEGIGYVFAYMLHGSLPWSPSLTREVEPSILFEGYPEAFLNFLEHVHNLEFAERPAYNTLKGFFHDVREREGPWSDHQFQWFDNAYLPEKLEPLVKETNLNQPDDFLQPASNAHARTCMIM